MSKLQKIKEELAKLLIKFEVIKTDNGVLEYEGELKEGIDVYVADPETEDKVPAADGEYRTEDNRIITVESGKITSIADAEEQPEEVETPEEVEEVIEVAEEQPEEVEPETPNEEVETPEELPETPNEVEELKTKVEELTGIVEELKTKVEELTEGLTKMSKMSAAKPAAEEFENVKTHKKTGDSKVDKFIERFGNK
ncbi:MAG: hypothetical protein J6R32_05095 [Bacteroidales bacterium]|nr:hypothetical protein [Bacteroidales bacterium]